ncbi:hypothetical protein [Jutongia sp.]|uniref:hypothetical protein n=1 Tax=Jutongia sp. TaxID=2944204 RepID=UPI003079B468
MLSCQETSLLWNLTTMFAGLLIGPACIILTISGFANSFFTVIERENLMAEQEEKESTHLNGEPISEDEDDI